MKIPFRYSIACKIGLTIIVIEAAALTLLGQFYLRRFSAQVDRALYASLARPGDLMSHGLLTFNTIAEREALDKLVGSGLVDAMVIGANGNIFHSTSPGQLGAPAEKFMKWNPDWLKQAQTGPIVVEERNSGDTFLTRISPIGVEAGRTPFLFAFVKMRTTAAENEKAELRRYFIAGSVATMFATSIALLLCFRLMLANRLSRVASAVDRVAEGDWAARVAGRPGCDEIGHMHRGVDAMAERLQTTIRSLEATVAELHAAIAARKSAEAERLKLERQVLHAQKLESMGILAGGIAHDFNNILTAVLGHAEMALMLSAPDAPVRENLTQIEQAAQRAAALSRQMLAYSGKGRFVVTTIRLNELVSEMGQLLSASVTKNVRMDYELAENLPPINGDSTQLGQVVMNLITNASESIGNRQGVVTMRTGQMYCDGTYLSEDNPAFESKSNHAPEPGIFVYIEVEDTGTGMNTATLERIFDPFFTTKFTGRGLGLAAVLGIVRGHRGALKVRSTPGHGTTFRVLFPAFGLRVPVIAEPPPQPAGETWRGNGTILLVDDEEQVRLLGREMLRELGFDVILAQDGRVAVDIVGLMNHQIRCVVLDLTMPNLDGEAAFNEIHRLRPDLPVILCSGFSEQSIAERFAGKDIAGFLHKPFTFSDFAARLKATLEKNP